ncbi:MAG: SpoIIE family protein phosphatase, partial [Spirochaetaceae bacterium]|nr:SpoIIE family protein phosphatase [Spirochaetaceae bacterium]
PFAVSFWRRSISVAGKKDPAVISLIDFVLAAFVSIWGVIDLLSPSTLPKFAYAILSVDPMPWFLVWSATVALVLWFAKTIGRRPNRLSSLFLWLISVAVPAVFFSLGSGLMELPGIFIDLGLSVSIAATIPIAISSMKSDRKVTHFDILEAQEEEPEELEPLLEEADNDEIEMKTVTASAPKVPKNDNLLVSLRSGLYPESIPWDMNWDLASARQGSAHPSTGFHEIYTAPEGNLSGFSFMDVGSSDLESMLFAHIARSEILRLHKPGIPLPRIARRVHRKTSAAAGAAGSTMNGVIGRFRDDTLSFLPLSLPPLLLKRNAAGKIITLQPFEGQAANPALGSPRFGEKGLRTVNVSMFGGDVMAIYTPALLEAVSPGGRLWGVRGLAEALKNSKGMKSEEIVADIIGSLKDFIARDRLDFPLQILIIRKR